LKVPFDKEDNSGIIYVWVGSQSDPEEARITEEIAREMYDGVRTLSFPIDRFRVLSRLSLRVVFQ